MLNRVTKKLARLSAHSRRAACGLALAAVACPASQAVAMPSPVATPSHASASVASDWDTIAGLNADEPTLLAAARTHGGRGFFRSWGSRSTPQTKPKQEAATEANSPAARTAKPPLLPAADPADLAEIRRRSTSDVVNANGNASTGGQAQQIKHIVEPNPPSLLIPPLPAPSSNSTVSSSSQVNRPKSAVTPKPQQSVSRLGTPQKQQFFTPTEQPATTANSGSRLNVTYTAGMTEKQRTAARIAAYKRLMSSQKPVAPPVAPPVPMSLRPGHGAIVSAPARSNGKALPPALPPIDAIVPPTQLAETAPKAAERGIVIPPAALPKITSLPAVAAPPKTASIAQQFVPPIEVKSAPPVERNAVAAAPLEAADGPVDLTTPEPETFPLQQMRELPLAMPSHQELFPADKGRFVDPETLPLAPATQTAPQAPEVAQVREDADVATVSIDELSPKPKPLPVAPAAEPIVQQAEPAAAPQFALPSLKVRRTQTGVAGFCPVALHNDRALVDSDPAFESVYLGRLYQFASAEARDEFNADPRSYAPAARGRDVVLLADNGSVADGKLDFAVWFRGRLYLFAGAGSMKTFSENPSRYVARN